MGHWRMCLLSFMASAILGSAFAAGADSRFLASAKTEDTTHRNTGGGDLVGAAKERVLPEVNEISGGTPTAEQQPEGRQEMEEGNVRDGKKKFEEDNEAPGKEAPDIHIPKDKDTQEKNEGEKVHPSEPTLTDLLHAYLFPHASNPPRPQQQVFPPRPIPLPLANVAVALPRFPAVAPLPGFPLTIKRPALPVFPPVATARTTPAHRSPITAAVPTADMSGNSLHADSTARESVEGSQTPISLQTIPVTTWLKMIANALSDEVYKMYVHRQASPDPNSADAPSRINLLEEQAESGSAVETKLPNEPEHGRVKPELPALVLPGFKRNKSMRPYVTSPVPVFPYYTFDKPPHFDFPPPVSPSKLSETEAEQTESTAASHLETSPSHTGPQTIADVD